jgi:hypothetical protein
VGQVGGTRIRVACGSGSRNGTACPCGNQYGLDFGCVHIYYTELREFRLGVARNRVRGRIPLIRTGTPLLMIGTEMHNIAKGKCTGSPAGQFASKMTFKIVTFGPNWGQNTVSQYPPPQYCTPQNTPQNLLTPGGPTVSSIPFLSNQFVLGPHCPAVPPPK